MTADEELRADIAATLAPHISQRRAREVVTTAVMMAVSTQSMEGVTPRKTVDTITDTELDALYGRLDVYIKRYRTARREVAAKLKRAHARKDTAVIDALTSVMNALNGWLP